MTRDDFLNEEGVVQPIESDRAILGFFGKYRCLSNFHHAEFEHEGLTFTCSEAAYMAQKTLDMSIRRKFCTLSGAEAKSMGRRIALRPDWDRVRIHAMYGVLLSKFFQDVHSQLTLIGTGDKVLVEANWWGDTFWGQCDGVGQNHLGQILMTIRDFIVPKNPDEDSIRY